MNAASLLKMTDGKVSEARIVLGAVAPVPYRASEAEALLKGKAVTESLAEQAAATLEGKAVVLSSNSYKLQIAKTLLKRVILAEADQNNQEPAGHDPTYCRIGLCEIKGRPTPQQLWWTREGYKEYLALIKVYTEEGL